MTEGLREHWTLDKRIPLALIFAVLMQSFAAIWWASTTNEKIESLTRVTQTNYQNIEGLKQSGQAQSIRAENLSGRIDRLADSIDKLQKDVTVTNDLLQTYLREQRDFIRSQSAQR